MNKGAFKKFDLKVFFFTNSYPLFQLIAVYTKILQVLVLKSSMDNALMSPTHRTIVAKPFSVWFDDFSINSPMIYSLKYN